MHCTNCGNQIDDSAKFCDKCGQAVAAGVAANVTVNVAAPAPQQATAAGGISPKSRTIAGILAFFLGSIGAHRFYTGKTGTAIAQLVLTVIGYATLAFVVGMFVLMAVGIWILIDLIMILMGKFKDKNGLLLKQ